MFAATPFALHQIIIELTERSLPMKERQRFEVDDCAVTVAVAIARFRGGYQRNSTMIYFDTETVTARSSATLSSPSHGPTRPADVQNRIWASPCKRHAYQLRVRVRVRACV